MTQQHRAEQEIFDELATLCTSPGYIHAIAFLAFRDNVVQYSGEMKPEDMQHLFSRERLIRTELSTLIGLLAKSSIDYSIPGQEILKTYIERTEALLKEIHDAMSASIWPGVDLKGQTSDRSDSLSTGGALREPIFYGGESAYSFQYRDFAPAKYARDDDWLRTHAGFSIATARDVVCAVGTLLNEKASAKLTAMRRLPVEQWTLLPAHEYTAREIADRTGISEEDVERVLSVFAWPDGERNHGFNALHDFNRANATPLLRHDDKFILFHIYSLAEAVYESPFYWMAGDKTYVNTAMENRGLFTEEFSTRRLASVFDPDRVRARVDVFESKTSKAGEIDVLVFFGNRGIVLQAKSKRLTLEARKGNDLQIRDDFKKSIQGSYDQGLRCAELLLSRKCTLRSGDGTVIAIPPDLKEVYVLCVVADHYPALSYQASQFLKFEVVPGIPAPFVLDVFTLDAMTEMLSSPLYLLSYIDRRVKYADRLMVSHELTTLSYHLKRNLWVDDKHDMVWLEDDISADLDLAMTARRDGILGQKTPDGILTRLAGTAIGHLIEQIDSRPDSAAIDLGFVLLGMSEATAVDVDKGIDRVIEMTRADGRNHDVTVGLGRGDSGLTIHCNRDPVDVAGPRLEAHCRLRKYTQRAQTWFGLCLEPADSGIRLGIALDFSWEQNAQMDKATLSMSRPRGLLELLAETKRKVGRNDPCSCGSGKKFKKCCGAPRWPA